jgi:uncharacterized protein YecE (DUF72 family)
MGWLKYSPPNFLFTAKMPKLITHDKRLGLKTDIKADLATYFDLMRPLHLGGKLSCFLIQLPPKCDCNYDNLESFFGMLDPLFRYSIEFRNLSWLRDETWELLKKYNVAYTIVDEPLLPPEIHLTTDFAYFRWHGKGENIWFDYNYSKEELDNWVPKIQQTSKTVKKVIGFFNNHYHGYSPENCLYMLEKLGLQSENQKKVKNKSNIKQAHLGSFFS